MYIVHKTIQCSAHTHSLAHKCIHAQFMTLFCGRIEQWSSFHVIPKVNKNANTCGYCCFSEVFLLFLFLLFSLCVFFSTWTNVIANKKVLKSKIARKNHLNSVVKWKDRERNHNSYDMLTLNEGQICTSFSRTIGKSKPQLDKKNHNNVTTAFVLDPTKTSRATVAAEQQQQWKKDI